MAVPMWIPPVSIEPTSVTTNNPISEPPMPTTSTFGDSSSERWPPCLASFAAADKLAVCFNKLLVRHDGQQVPIADSAAPILDQQGCLSGAVMVFHDVGHARKLARQLSYQARHDPLTGLFSETDAIHSVAVTYLWIMAISYGAYGMVMATCAAWRCS